MKAALCSLTIWFAVACGNPLAAQEVDGLNAEMRKSVYNSRTALVATLDLKQLDHQTLMRTFYGFFDPTSLGHVRKNSKDFDKEIEGWLSGYTSLAGGLATAKYQRATVIGLENEGLGLFAVLPLGFDIDDGVFIAAKFALELLFSAAKFNVKFTRMGDFVLIHSPGAALPVVAYSPEVERAVLKGLGQRSGAPAVAFVAPTNEYVRTWLVFAWQASGGELGEALGQADYLGGYLVGGDQPELHLYARFGDDGKAASVKALYELSWDEQIAEAIAVAEAQEKAAAEGQFIITSRGYISTETMYRRVAAASAPTVFGGFVLLDLNTVELREITGALVDRYYRSASKSP